MNLLWICDAEDFPGQSTNEVDRVINWCKLRDGDSCTLVDTLVVLNLKEIEKIKHDTMILRFCFCFQLYPIHALSGGQKLKS